MTCNKCEALQRILVQQDKDDAAWRKQVLELQAHINDLREALEEISNWKFGWDGDCGVTAVAEQALTKTPAQSLQEHDNEVIERCAKVLEQMELIGGLDFAEAIRALKGSK